MTPCTPVFGRADESVEDAPTHQTELVAGAANDRPGRGLGDRVGVVTQTNSPPKISTIRRTGHAAFMQKISFLYALYTVWTGDI